MPLHFLVLVGGEELHADRWLDFEHCEERGWQRPEPISTDQTRRHHNGEHVCRLLVRSPPQDEYEAPQAHVYGEGWPNKEGDGRGHDVRDVAVDPPLVG